MEEGEEKEDDEADKEDVEHASARKKKHLSEP